jgi:monoamine oxidase
MLIVIRRSSRRLFSLFVLFRPILDSTDASFLFLSSSSDQPFTEAIDWYIGRWGYTDDEVIDFLDFMGASVEIENAGDSSLLDINEISFFPPGYAVDSYYMGMPGEGFGNVAARYAAPHASSIRLNSRVIEVDSDAESDVTVVTYVNEDGETIIVKAKTVLVTVSLGVLKAGTITFVPALPENKASSIEAMGFGLINKCILSWEDDAALVWPRDEMWFMLITPDEEASGRWTTFFNPLSLKGRPTLTSFVAGNDAIAMEGQTDEEVVADVMTNLRAMFPDIPDPDGVIVTRWGLEEDFLGAHSFPVPGRVIADDSAALSESYGRIYFAGEATDAWWGTTLGAWNSGEDQALAMAQKLLGA